jgi:hypothetical protein
VKWSLRQFHTTPERSSMPHANAPLTDLDRLSPARCVVDDGRPLFRPRPVMRSGAGPEQPASPTSTGPLVSRPPSTNIHGCPAPKSSPTRRKQRRVSGGARTPGSPATRSPSSGCCRTTAPATSQGSGTPPAPNSASRPKDPTIPAADQRKVERFHRTLTDEWPTPSAAPAKSPTRLPAHLQSPPAPLRHRRSTRRPRLVLAQLV